MESSIVYSKVGENTETANAADTAREPLKSLCENRLRSPANHPNTLKPGRTPSRFYAEAVYKSTLQQDVKPNQGSVTQIDFVTGRQPTSLTSGAMDTPVLLQARAIPLSSYETFQNDVFLSPDRGDEPDFSPLPVRSQLLGKDTTPQTRYETPTEFGNAPYTPYTPTNTQAATLNNLDFLDSPEFLRFMNSMQVGTPHLPSCSDIFKLEEFEDGSRGTPESFNDLTPGMILNNSDKYADESWKTWLTAYSPVSAVKKNTTKQFASTPIHTADETLASATPGEAIPQGEFSFGVQPTICTPAPLGQQRMPFTTKERIEQQVDGAAKEAIEMPPPEIFVTAPVHSSDDQSPERPKQVHCPKATTADFCTQTPASCKTPLPQGAFHLMLQHLRNANYWSPQIGQTKPADKQRSPVTPEVCLGMVDAVELAAQESVCAATRGELEVEGFEAWLANAGIKTDVNAPVRHQLQEMWGAVAEVKQLRQLVETVKETELQLAAAEAQELEERLTDLVYRNVDLEEQNQELRSQLGNTNEAKEGANAPAEDAPEASTSTQTPAVCVRACPTTAEIVEQAPQQVTHPPKGKVKEIVSSFQKLVESHAGSPSSRLKLKKQMRSPKPKRSTARSSPALYPPAAPSFGVPKLYSRSYLKTPTGSSSRLARQNTNVSGTSGIGSAQSINNRHSDKRVDFDSSDDDSDVGTPCKPPARGSRAAALLSIGSSHPLSPLTAIKMRRKTVTKVLTKSAGPPKVLRSEADEQEFLRRARALKICISPYYKKKTTSHMTRD